MDLFKLLGTIAIDNKDANKALDDTSSKGKQTEGKLSKAFKGIGKGAVAVGKAVGAGMLAAGTAVVGLVTQSTQSYAQYEQLVGGVETLFGNSASKVLDYANKAFQTAGMSANAYMETVTSFSASLLQSLGGDTEKAADKADMAIRDMSDNANKMGTSMEMIQNAYQGFAKQNYTMLDNLKLGYGGTKTEMERLLADAEKISGIKYDISSYADVVDAIHVIQTEMGITGTTAAEAAGTMAGSAASVKAAWANLMTAMSDENADLGAYVKTFTSSLSTMIENFLPRIGIALEGVVELVDEIAPIIIKKVPELLGQLLPAVIEAAVGLVNSIVEILPSLIDMLVNQALPGLIEGFVQLVNAIVLALPGLLNTILAALPTLLPLLINGLMSMVLTLCTMIPQLIQPIIDNLPGIISSLINALLSQIPAFVEGLIGLTMGIVEALPDAVKVLCDALLSNLPLLIEGIIALTMGIVSALPEIITVLCDAIPSIIEMITDALLQALPQLVAGCVQLTLALVEKLPEIIKALCEAVPSIVKALVDAFNLLLPMLDQCGKDLLQGLMDGMIALIGDIPAMLSDIWDAIVGGLKALFGIHSPSTVMAGLGKNIMQGLLGGIESLVGNVSGIWNKIKGTTTNIWNGIKDAITKPINTAKEKVGGVVDKIKGMFGNAKLEFPGIKMPKFSIKPKGWEIDDLLKGKIPKLGIDWYAKAMNDPIIMDKPTVFGYNGSTGELMAGGDAGSEVVAGTNTLMNMIQGAVAAQNSELLSYFDRLLDMLASYFPEALEAMRTPATFDPDRAAKVLAGPMNRELGTIYARKDRGR